MVKIPDFGNKRGDKVLSIYWFVILFIVTGAVVYMASIFYGAPYDVRAAESSAMGNQIADCLTSQGYLKADVLASGLQGGLVKACNLNFSVEDSYGWTNQSEYYSEVNIYKYDPNEFGLTGAKVMNASAGNPFLKTLWQLNSGGDQKSPGAFASAISSISNLLTGKRNVDTIVIHATEGATSEVALGALETRGLTIHYLIDSTGTIISPENNNVPSQYANTFVSENDIAYHAGCGTGSDTITSCSADCVDSNGLLDAKCQNYLFGGNFFSPDQGARTDSKGCCIQDPKNPAKNFNTNSIGIEIVNLGPICGDDSYKNTDYCKGAVSADGTLWQKYSPEQIDSLVNLVYGIAQKHNIPLDRDHIVGHYQINTYKTDPGAAFPWDEFMQKLKDKSLDSSLADQKTVDKNLPQGQQRSFYAVDKTGHQYIVQILTLVKKTEKNVA